MKTLSFPLLGLLVAISLLASSSVSPASAQVCHARFYVNIHTGCCGCKFNMSTSTACLVTDCNDCTDGLPCSGAALGAAAQGKVVPLSALQCSLGEGAWSRLAAPTGRLQVQVVKLKA